MFSLARDVHKLRFLHSLEKSRLKVSTFLPYRVIFYTRNGVVPKILQNFPIKFFSEVILRAAVGYFRPSSSPKDLAYGCPLDELKKATIQLVAN